MSVVNPGNPRSERVPAVFDDRVIFGYPDPGASHAPPPPQPRSGAAGAVVAAVAIMLIPCAFLGWLAWVNIDARDNDDSVEIAALTTRNETLEQRIRTAESQLSSANGRISELEKSLEIVRSVGDLLQQREQLVASIRPKLPSNADAQYDRWLALKDRPVWDKEAIEILTRHNAGLRQLEAELQRRLDAVPTTTRVEPAPITAGRTE